VKAEVSWHLKISPDIKVTDPPTETELKILREKVDPQRLWSGGKRAMPGAQKESLD